MSEIETIQQQIDELQELVERKDLALKLEKNREFKKLILEIFCEKECARFARNSGDPAISPENRADSLALAQAAGHLRRFLSLCVTQGYRAEHEIVQGKAALEELRHEGNG